MKIKKVIISLILIFTILICGDYINYRQKKIIEVKTSLIEDIKSINNGKYLINEIIPFEWDQICIFEPYVGDKYIYEKIGKEYTTASNYLSYKLVDNHSGLHYDHLKKMVILKDGIVIYDENYDRLKLDFEDSFYFEDEVRHLYKNDNMISLQ
ncbi:hypothetical protein SH1V18_43850 [Vallitalea longa]|uniref:Uncharacterized protein n=1 Tax=Vallitalea longa TaxID=2936439 RepID=A0A9W6DGR2_9FIRM|nr:hypothetical protein [Vallitalea longa]GKX31905.1 hypothetical protein SH1V18_43850 [Vallitalea longa]